MPSRRVRSLRPRQLRLEVLEVRRVLFAPYVVDLQPPPNSHSAAPDTSVEVTFSQALASGSVSDQTVVVHAQQSGRLLSALGDFAALSTDGPTVTLDPAGLFHPGELIQMSVTSGVTSLGSDPAVPHVWQFRTAVTSPAAALFADNGDRPHQQFAKSAAIGDLNHDGNTDFVVVHDGTSPLRIWDDPLGTFPGPVQELDNSGGVAIALGDLNGDGHLDIFVGNQGESRIWFNDGFAGFTDSGQRLPTPLTVHLDLGDLDGDGDLDAWIAERGVTRIWLNDGAGTFQDSGQILATPAASSVALGDFNGDGDLDALVTQQGQPSQVWFNRGSGQFVNSGQLLGSDSSVHVVLHDLDADGDLDAVVANDRDQPSTIWLNDGVGRFTASSQILPSAIHQGLALADLEQDGDADLLLLYEGVVQIWSNNGLGEFLPAGQEFVIPAATGIMTQRIDPNFSLDALVITNEQTHRFLLNDNRGLLREMQQALGAFGTRAVALADFDGDGDLDAFLANALNLPSLVWWNDGAGNFTDSGQRLGAAVAHGITIGDVDGDGDLDVYLANRGISRLWLNDGHGMFADSGQEFESLYASGAWLGDLDGDGDLDIFATNFDEPNRVWFNDGFGNFTDSGQRLGRSNTSNMAMGDIDGDGDLDAFVTNFRKTNALWLNDGTGFFTDSGQDLGYGSNVNVALGDLDGDGDLDVYITRLGFTDYTRPGTANIVLFNDGHGNLTDSGQALGDAHSFGIALADLDGDGDLDAFAGNFGGPSRIWLNDGTGHFSDSGQRLGDVESLGVAVGDVDGDGDLDLLEGNYRFPSRIWLNEPLDFGDAPSEYFPTRAEHDGARHRVPAQPTLFLGAAVDADPTGQANRAADGDDQSGLDDEDGIELLTPLVAGSWATLLVTASADGGYLNGWVDFNHNGSWLDPSEQVAVDLPLVAGVNSVAIWVPINAVATTQHTYARFRLSSQSGLAPTGWAPDGEVEDYVWSLAGLDFGDAPAPYATTLAEDGARHVARGPVLGTRRDMEPEGQPSAGAQGDDQFDYDDDEDGIVVDPLRAGLAQAVVYVAVSQAPLGAKLDAWIDFNGDGAWGGPFEQIARSVSVSEGLNPIRFEVPSGITDGTRLARFRLSSAGQLGPAGFADDGEVEDHLVVIDPPATADLAWAAANLIAADSQGVTAVRVLDLDRDGDLDVLAVSPLAGTLSWYENSGPALFTKHVLVSDLPGIQELFPTDVDGDGDWDLVVASSSTPAVSWFENNGSQSFSAHSISSPLSAAHAVFVADIDADGDPDLIAASASDGALIWLENDGTGNFASHQVSAALPGVRTVCAADLDGDGDLDLVAGASGNNTIAWYQNDGAQVFTERIITTTAMDVTSVHVADLDGDGDQDLAVAAAGDHSLSWYEYVGQQNYVVHLISSQALANTPVLVTDFDGDGDLDVLFAPASGPGMLLAENGGTAGFQITILADVPAAAVLAGGDLDGDGDLDWVTALAPQNVLAWHETLGGFDFGDAPAPYPTGVAEDGPRHALVGPRLGSYRDRDDNGHNSAGADADDLNGAEDDEDGVVFGRLMVGQRQALIQVTVQDVPTVARLNVWIDFDGDGSWAGWGEQIAADLPVVNGVQELRVDIPAWAAPGMTGARVRLSTSAGLGPAGAAPDGEVEDYVVAIEPAEQAGVMVVSTTITESAVGCESLDAADMDGDGDLDLIAACAGNDLIAWYENDGTQQFTAHAVSTSALGARAVRAVDLDGDGDLDLITASAGDNTIAWYENTGLPQFTFRAITTAAIGAASVWAADLDGDGDLDLLSASSGDDTIRWYENEGTEHFTPHLLSVSARGAAAVFAMDLNGDGRLDIVTASTDDDTIAWYQNLGDRQFVFHSITTEANGANAIWGGDLNGDGFQDLVATSWYDRSLRWYAGDGQGGFVSQLVASDLAGPRSVQLADLDGDGDLDILTSASFENRIVWYQNEFENGEHHLITHRLPLRLGRVAAAIAADVDGDEDLDLVASAASEDRLVWLRSERYDFGDAPESYLTRLADNGPRHLSRGPLLGAYRDSEANGYPGLQAQGDDQHRPDDDEDGVAFTSWLAAGALVTVEVTASEPGMLNAWVDFARDGSFAQSGDQIFWDTPLVTGINQLTFTVPATAVSGATFARFRVNTAGGLSFFGSAEDGEVEDYAVSICSTTVTQSGDSGPGSLRAAIECSNRALGVQAIDFQLPLAKTYAISPITPLPAITDPVTLDATTQAGYQGQPIIQLDGSYIGPVANGLTISAGSSTIRGLIIQQFKGHGIELTTQGQNVLENNFIGTDRTGRIEYGNGGDGIRISDSPDNRIGPENVEDEHLRNVIAGNKGSGIALLGATATSNLIRGNFIGVTRDGDRALGNLQHGVSIVDAPDNLLDLNLISGNSKHGVQIQGALATDNLVQRNVIGLANDLDSDLGNLGSGVVLVGTMHATIGGGTPGLGNVVSGNEGHGVVLNSGATGNLIARNLIGLDATGLVGRGNTNNGVLIQDSPGNEVRNNFISANRRTGFLISGSTASANRVYGNVVGLGLDGDTDLGNTNYGVWILSAPGTVVGDVAAGTGNVISGNDKHGVVISGAAGTILRQNLIGTDATGLLARGNTSYGVWLDGAVNTLVGGTEVGAGNVVAANGKFGILISGTASSDNRLQGNWIGTNPNLFATLGNGDRGIQITGGARNNTIGGSSAQAANVIAYNTNAGVGLLSDAGVGNGILRNAIVANTGLGIDLGAAGVTANDAGDGDLGPNKLQNYPLISAAAYSAGNTTVTGSLNSIRLTSFRIQFFRNAATDPTNYGEGQQYLGEIDVLTNGSGNASFSFVYAGDLRGAWITATATEIPGNNTSEFSQARLVPGTPSAGGAPLQNSDNPLDVNGDSFVSPIDVLLLFDILNGGTAAGAGEEAGTALYLDVNGDGKVTLIDSLLVINFLNEPNSSYPMSADGAGPRSVNRDSSADEVDTLLGSQLDAAAVDALLALPPDGRDEVERMLAEIAEELHARRLADMSEEPDLLESATHGDDTGEEADDWWNADLFRRWPRRPS